MVGEPEFQLLSNAFQGGSWLFDIWVARDLVFLRIGMPDLVFRTAELLKILMSDHHFRVTDLAEVTMADLHRLIAKAFHALVSYLVFWKADG